MPDDEQGSGSVKDLLDAKKLPAAEGTRDLMETLRQSQMSTQMMMQALTQERLVERMGGAGPSRESQRVERLERAVQDLYVALSSLVEHYCEHLEVFHELWNPDLEALGSHLRYGPR